MTYSEKLKSPRWQKKRLEILKRDNFTCQSCGDEESTLHVHHSYYEKGKPPWDYPSESLSTQCEKCHTEIEGLLFSIRRYVADNTSLCKRTEQFAAALACDEKRFKRLIHAVSAFSDLLMDYDLFGADDATFRNTIAIMVSSLVQQRNDDEARLEKIMNSHENQNNQA